MSDFTFMKSGFDNLESPDESLENISSIVMVFMENALKSADIYVRHAERKQITPEDIKRALMLEVFFMKSRPNQLEKCEEMKQKIKDIIREEEENSDDDEEVYLDDNDEEEEFTESKCECPMCNCFNFIYDRWDDFIPQLPMEKILAKHIENM